MRNNYIAPAIMLAGAALAACSMQPEKNATLDDARSGYSAAQSNPDVTNFAAIELQQAGKALDEANAAQRKREDREVVDHLAYMAKQRVAIAQETAKLKAAESVVANAGAARDKVRLEARTAEADAAKQGMATAQETAKQNADELAAANADIERGKLRLEAQTAETDAAAKQQATISEADANQAAAALAAANAEAERGKRLLDAQTAEADAAKQQAALAQESTNQKAAELAAANARVGQMETELKNLNAKKTERGLVITLGDVLFDTNKAELRSEGTDSVQKLAEFLIEYPDRKTLIEGYTDSTGSSNYNQDLSERRANAVRSKLMGMGVSGDRIGTRGYGEEKPIASNETAAGRQLNRRVEIILSDESGSSIAPR